MSKKMDQARHMRHHELIDLVSDDDADVPLPEANEAHLRAEEAADPNFLLDRYLSLDALDDANDADDADQFHWTAFNNIPDFEVPPDPFAEGDPAPGNLDAIPVESDLMTEPVCLQMVLDVLPDISIEHVLSLIRERTQDRTRTPANCERLVAHLLDGGTYPKEHDEAQNRKRKRGASDGDLYGYEDGGDKVTSAGYSNDALALLKIEFLEVPERHLRNVLLEQKSLFKAYCTVQDQVRNYPSVGGTFTKIFKARRASKEVLEGLTARGSTAPKELEAAKRKIEKEAVKRHKAEEFKRVEEENMLQAQMKGEMTEWEVVPLSFLCCFDDFPINRMTSCTGNTMHFFCLECAKKYIEGEMGAGRCRPVCFADPNCGATFTRQQLQRILGDKSFERLEHMQQQHDLAAADLDFLSECPFCDFKAECLPVEVDKEFRCLNPKCGKVSCRLCQTVTHVPLSCEESKKDSQITVRHTVEEAMSAALIRHCNKCKHAFVKEYGCNKMTCSHCRNVQCYVCSANVKNYDHFNEAPGQGRCPLHDNVENRHEAEVKKAADEAMAKVQAENPGISEADLMIQVSDRVKQADAARRDQAQAARVAVPDNRLGGFPVQHAYAPRFAQAPVAAAPVLPYVQDPFPVVPVVPAYPAPYVLQPQMYPQANLAPMQYMMPQQGVNRPLLYMPGHNLVNLQQAGTQQPQQGFGMGFVQNAVQAPVRAAHGLYNQVLGYVPLPGQQQQQQQPQQQFAVLPQAAPPFRPVAVPPVRNIPVRRFPPRQNNGAGALHQQIPVAPAHNMQHPQNPRARRGPTVPAQLAPQRPPQA